MKKFIATFAAVAAIGLGSAAMAQNAMSGDAMHGDAMHGDAMHSDAMHGDAMMPTAVCRAAMKGETANTHMGADDLMCKKFDLAKAKATFEKMMMALPGEPTQADVDAAWQKAFGNANLIGQRP
jgi:pentapeptide MXKDX repeat protein